MKDGLAGFTKHGKPWVDPRIKGDKRRRIMRHQKTFLKERSKGKSKTVAIRAARKAEHKGLSKKQIQKYEGQLGAIARRL